MATAANPPEILPSYRLSALASEPGGADRVSGLPDAVLMNIVSRLPVKEAARTATVLSRRRLPYRRFAPLVPVDEATAANPPRQGMNPHGLEGIRCRKRWSSCVILPSHPVYTRARLSALASEPGGADRVSGLPDAVLVNIVSRLPVKEAARTAVLSRRWRPVWRSAPLVLVDENLFRADGKNRRHQFLAVHDSVSSIFAAHPGPFRCVYLTSLDCSIMGEYRAQLVRWLQLLSVKGVQELVLINSPWRKPLPSAIFGLGNLTRLHLALWRFPDTAGLPPGVTFLSLRELGLSSVFINSKDVEFLISRSPRLEILNCEGNMAPLRLPLKSDSLRCLQIQGSNVEEIAVVDAPNLERFVIPGNWARTQCKVTIGNAPVLRIFGYFEPRRNELRIIDTSIKDEDEDGMWDEDEDEMRTYQRYMDCITPILITIPTVKILAVQVQFDDTNSDVKRLLMYLRKFSCIESLHIQSLELAGSTKNVYGTSSLEFCGIKCVQSEIKVMVFHDFHGFPYEITFLQQFVTWAGKLKRLVILDAKNRSSTKRSKVIRTLERRFKCRVDICLPKPGVAGPWDMRSGSDFSNSDPFMFSVRF